ncbi:MAG: hypothetical protein ACR2RD_13100, partial [Woeseiaceae bacterium]
MSKFTSNEQISPLIRVISGVIGVLGFVAIAYNTYQDGGLQLDLILFASFFAGVVFLYVSFF